MSEFMSCKRMRCIASVTIFSGCIIGCIVGCSADHPAPPPVVSVQLATAHTSPITVILTGEATLFPLHQAILATKISAPIARYYVQRGDRVHQGELLATLENGDLQGAALGSQGQYQQAKALYATTTQATVPQELQKAQLDLTQTKAQVDLETRIYESRSKLFTEGALPGRDVDQARVAMVQAKTLYAVARHHLKALENVSRKAELSSATGQLQQAQGQDQQAQAMLSYSQIRSPINGYVTDRPLYAGEMATAGSPLLTVMDLDVLVAKAHLPQPEIESLQIGAPAQVFVPGVKNPVAGKVMLISPALDPGSTTVEIWVRVDNRVNNRVDNRVGHASGEAHPRLQPGTPVHIAVNASTIPDALVVPISALVQDVNGGTHVMVVNADQIAHTQKVQVGVEADGQAQILSGLAGGVKVVTVGSYAMEDGTHVRVASTNSTAVTTGAAQ